MLGSEMMAKAAAAGMLAAAAAIALAGPAVADWNSPVPTPGDDGNTDAGTSAIADHVAGVLGPAPLAGRPMPLIGAPLGPEGINLLGQRNNSDPTAATPGGILGLPPGTAGLSPGTVLGQNAKPSAPGSGTGTVPNLNALNNSYGPAECVKPSAPGQCEQFGVDPGQENANISPHDLFHRYMDMYHDGRLKGGSLSQLSQQQLGEPLPGTAPLPGTNIPPGLGQYYTPPDPAPAPGAPPAPGAVPGAAPAPAAPPAP